MFDNNGEINNTSFSPNNMSKYLHLFKWIYNTDYLAKKRYMPHEIIYGIH